MKLLSKFKRMSKLKKVLVTAIAVPVLLFSTIVVSVIIDDSNANEVPNSGEYSLMNGELLDVVESGNVLVIKAKIKGNVTDKLTIQQNAHNVEDFILKNDLDDIEELQYWAVADMSDGEESKVISFTLDESMINSIKNRSLVALNLLDKAKDVWIHPSLNNN